MMVHRWQASEGANPFTKMACLLTGSYGGIMAPTSRRMLSAAQTRRDSSSLNNTLKQINSTYNLAQRVAGGKVTQNKSGEAELTTAFRREDMAQCMGFLHDGLIGAMLDTACGFAAGTVAGCVLASRLSVSELSPAVGEVFLAKGRLVKGLA
ncbi:PaaI family thioesterase [Pseudomonas sp. P8_241]|uniref:PaaI family thioesterase n=1 Tax=Pseudomonas sp. P8_241 TaxID=3043445 RepID=UPI002A35C865|nr:PaaI family thioesterase [Pseudomonas sp. P8_241]WPN50014.1 PaaI family thioesterase [Pseudomonas sp. P8_241]